MEAATQELLEQQFEQQKALITERSRIRPRPAEDLRAEERVELLSRMVRHLYAPEGGIGPSPLEIESFRAYFDTDRMCYYLHPSWWRPRPRLDVSGPDGERTALASWAARRTRSPPTARRPPMGSSLGWLIQLDGDKRRNAFLNSPWVRVCIPVKRGREREAVQWLAERLEGREGFDLDTGPLAELIERIEAYRDKEARLGKEGPEYVTAATPPVGDVAVIERTGVAEEGPLRPEGVYPVVDRFEVTVPTDGFVYETLVIEGGA